jgi:hypothetical protein
MVEGAEGVTIPDKDEVQADVCGPSYKYDSNTRLLLEKKEDMRRRGVPSPDIGDAIALTFARPVAPPRPASDMSLLYRSRGGGWRREVARGPDSLHWFWSMTIKGPLTRSNLVATLDEAKVQFHKSLDAWPPFPYRDHYG